MRFHFVPLLIDDTPQFALHRFECVVDDFGERFVRAVVSLLFISHELVTRRNRHINAATIRISFLMGVIWLLDGDVAAIDVIAKSFQPRRVLQNEIVDVVRFFEAAISDLDGQLHK